jgi:hypothetical protein
MRIPTDPNHCSFVRSGQLFPDLGRIVDNDGLLQVAVEYCQVLHKYEIQTVIKSNR